MKWKGLENHNRLSPVPKDFSLCLFSVFFATYVLCFQRRNADTNEARCHYLLQKKMCPRSLFRLQLNWLIIRRWLEKLFWKQLTYVCNLWRSFGFSNAYEQLIIVHMLSDAPWLILSLSLWSTSLSTSSSTISALGGVRKKWYILWIFPKPVTPCLIH